MEKSIYKYVWGHTKKDQIILILMTLASMPPVYYALEIPKRIINDVLQGSPPFAIFGMPVSQVQYLFTLSSLFLVMVVVNGGMKYIINVYRGVLGERMLRRFRYTLYCRILRFPMSHFREVSPGEIIPMVTAETEPLGGFIGDSIALPVMQGGLLFTYIYFIMVQDWLLGIAAIAFYPIQMWLIPKLQRRVNLLSKERVQNLRKISDRVGESVTGIADIHANATGFYERTDLSTRLGKIFSIRMELFRRKFFIKFLNNFIAQLTPFFFYLIGGLLVLQGDLTIGALVAVLAAYKDIAPPWKELLKFYQIFQDIKVKYAQIVEQFVPERMIDKKLLASTAEPPPRLEGDLRASRLSYSEDATTRVSGFNFELGDAQHSAIFSRDGSASDEVMQLLARLLPPTSGAIKIGKLDLQNLPESVTGRRIGYAAATTKLFNASIAHNLFYGLKHYPVNPQLATTATHEAYLKEARASGNSTALIDADWVDTAITGAESQDAFWQLTFDVIECVELDDDLLSLALRTADGIAVPEQLAAQIVSMREALVAQINAIEADDIIETLDPNRYIHNLTVEENLLFGTPRGNASATEFLARNPAAKQILQQSNLRQELIEIGLELANLMLEIFSDVPDDSELFEQFSFIDARDLPDYQQLVSNASVGGSAALGAAQRELLLGLSFQLCPARHRLQLITPKVQQKILAARKALMDTLGSNLGSNSDGDSGGDQGSDNPPIRFLDRTRYNHGMSIQENLLFGRIVYAKGHLQPRITEIIRDTLRKTHLNRDIIMAGLNLPVGAAGSKLSAAMRQKLVLARALLKQPDILIINNALSGIDNNSFARIVKRVLDWRSGKNLVWALNDATLLGKFDRVLIVEKAKLTHSDTPAALTAVLKAL